MGTSVKFEDYSDEVKNTIRQSLLTTLEECASELESQAKKNSRVNTGQTKNSFQHRVVDSEYAAYIGSDYENAIWEEFGTGEYALKGNGRKGGWKYQDDRGKWHYTTGKKPSRALWNAFVSLKKTIIRHFQDTLKGM